MTAAVSKSSPSENGKIPYIERLRVVLMVLVIVHHALLTYGASAGWYYHEKTHLFVAGKFMAVLITLDQSFFMGFFFFLAAYFIPSSLQKKGIWKYIKSRLVRLGLPLLLYAFVMSPMLVFIVDRFGYGRPVACSDYFGVYKHINFGVMWFVAALLLFTFAYLLFRKLFVAARIAVVPNIIRIFLLAIAIGTLTYVIRIFFPGNRVIDLFGFRLAYFTQYAVLFCCGIIAAELKWLAQPYPGMERKLKSAVLVLIFLGIPMTALLHITLTGPGEVSAQIKLAWQAIWEQLLGIFIISLSLLWSRRKWNIFSPVWSILADVVYATYFFHPVVLVSLSVALRHWQADPLIKFFTILPLAVSLSFMSGMVLVRVMGLKRSHKW